MINIKIIIYIDIIILIINLYLLFFDKIDFIYKNIDHFFISVNTQSFYHISDYLNKKYIKEYNLNDSSQTNKKYISLHFIQFNDDPFVYNLINDSINILNNKYLVHINPNNPDYLIYNVVGCDFLDSKYNNSIKIAYFTENQLPDFSKADYCIGNSHIIYLDRYFKMPFYYINSINLLKNDTIELIRNNTLKNNIRTKFCAAVISNSFITDGFRLNFINELNKYKIVDMGGSYNNNVGIIHDKIEFLSAYKFSIAMENTEGEGYLSEKIIDSFLSGTIPIYYGDYMIDEHINPEVYILVRGEKDIKNKIEYIKEIDNNDELYKKILRKKVIINNEYTFTITKEFSTFFEHIFEKNKSLAKRIDFNCMKYSTNNSKIY